MSTNASVNLLIEKNAKQRARIKNTTQPISIRLGPLPFPHPSLPPLPQKLTSPFLSHVCFTENGTTSKPTILEPLNKPGSSLYLIKSRTWL